jgi:hypothetical protein
MTRTNLITLGSFITVNTTDTEHLELHPSFVRPTGAFTIQAIGKVMGETNGLDRYSVYAEQNGNPYLLEIEASDKKIVGFILYQNVLTITPEENQWPETIQDITGIDIDLDSIHYRRSLGGDSPNIDLLEIMEEVKTHNDTYTCKNRIMQYERPLFNETDELLKVAVEVVEEKQQAQVSFYVGVQLHPSVLTIAG